MRLAYASIYDARDLHAGSRSGHLIPRALQAAGHTIDFLGPIETPRSLLERAIGRLARELDPGLHLPEREPALLARIGRDVDARLSALSRTNSPAPPPPIDALISFGVLALAGSRWPGVVGIWTDCTLAVMIDYFPGFTGLSRRAMRHATLAERDTLRRADVLAFPSAWAADSAIRDYGCDPRRVHVIPFGPSLPPPADSIDQLIACRARDPYRILWIGSEWDRKRGDLALAIGHELASLGLPVELTLVGALPPESTSLPTWAKALGTIARDTPQGAQQLIDLYRTSHFLLLPTLADCAPIVMRDAMLYALPIIATRTGGLPSMIDDGVEGHLFPLDAGPRNYAQAIASLLTNAARYAQACIAARARHDSEWNWPAAASRFADLLQQASTRR